MAKWLYRWNVPYGMIGYGQMEEIVPYHLSMQIPYRILSQVQVPGLRRCSGSICQIEYQNAL